MSFIQNIPKNQGRREGGGGAGGEIPGARTGLGARNLDKTSGHWATAKRVGGA